MNTTSEQLTVHITWLKNIHMPAVLDIEDDSFEFPWPEEDFIRCLSERNCIGMVAKHEDRVVGFMFYTLHKRQIRLLSLAVAIDSLRKGVGSQMVAKLIGKLSAGRRASLSLEVRESNVQAQFFFRSLGFRAESVLRDFYEDTPEDAYTMRFIYRGP